MRRRPDLVRERVPLAGATTFGLGGPARYFAHLRHESELPNLLEWADAETLKVLVLGGGSNLVVADEGVEALVVDVDFRGFSTEGSRVRIAAGEPWDACVDRLVGMRLSGVECLSGIPGRAGATPIQNVGAYGREIADVLESIEVWDRSSGRVRTLSNEECCFDYRNSRFKRQPDEFIVLEVRLELRHDAAPTVAYPELARRLARAGAPSLSEVREAVLDLRRAKSMVVDPSDPDSRSAGSFFTNPVLDTRDVETIRRVAATRGWTDARGEIPRYPSGDGRFKVPAAWLIERSGISKGLRRGGVGVSSRHVLALVHHGGGSTTALLALADEIRSRVGETFGVSLAPEPTLWGTRWPWSSDPEGGPAR